jgi:hypothetical protein
MKTRILPRRMYTLAPKPTNRILRRVCAWCKRPTDGFGPLATGQSITHVICDACSDAVIEEYTEKEMENRRGM